MPIHNKTLFQALRGGGVSLALFLGVASASNAAQSAAEFAKAAKFFQSACPASLSERTFRDYYAAVGANVQDTNNPNLPFAVGAILPGGVLMGTYYRKPAKCCVSMLNVDANKFTSELPRRLNLRGRIAVRDAPGKNMIVFKPIYANRIIGIDWKGPNKNGQTIANICQTEMPGAEAKYLSLQGQVR